MICPVSSTTPTRRKNRMSLRASARTGVALSKDSLRSQSPGYSESRLRASRGGHWPPKAPFADQGWCSAQRIRILMIASGNCSIMYRCLARPYASARRMRALPLPMGEVPLEGAERVFFTLSVGFAASSPKVGAKGKRIVTGGNPWKAIPVTSVASSQRHA